MEIIIPVLLLAVIGIICAVALTVANVFFGVEEDKLTADIRECLPGVNCGACGYSGCDGYAAALGAGEESVVTLCVPGGDSTANKIAGLLGVEAGDVVEKVAYVACNGTCDAVQMRYDYQGIKSCHNAKLSYGGNKACSFSCIGFGDCAAVCPQNAISIVDGVARVDKIKCIGCGICVRECPQGTIRLVDDVVRVAVQCSSNDKGAITRKNCKNGCIGCMKCVKSCPAGAITVVDNLATIDYSLCTGCGACADVCPVKCIYKGNFTCGARLN